MERERGIDVLAIRAHPTMKAPRTRMAWVMWMGRLKRSAKAKKLSMSFIVVTRRTSSVRFGWS